MLNKKNLSQSLWKLVLLSLILIAAGSQSAWATSGIKTKFLTAYPSAVGSRLATLPSATNHCGACHYAFSSSDAAPSNLNPYGEAIASNGNSSAQILAIGSLDSDGDGFTNDEEIQGMGFTNIPTFPGLKPSNVSNVSGVTLSEINGFLVPVASSCNVDAECDDNLFCNGIESCSTENSTCLAGTNPCTGDTPECVEETDTCVAAECPAGTPPEVLLYDEDGNCLLSKEELKTYSDALKASQKLAKDELKATQTAEKNQYNLIKKDYAE